MQQAGTRKSYLGLIIIVGTLFVLMLILVLVIGILVVARRANTATPVSSPIFGTNPLNQLAVDEIDPALALASLGGAVEADVISEAIDKERPETALAALLFNPALSNRETAGGFLQLAQTYAALNNLVDARFSYKMAGTVATLAPDLSDTVRADLFLQVGEGLIEINAPELAKFYLDQAFMIAANSPYLQAAHRRGIFERLQKNYIILNERTLARESLSLSANPPNLSLVTEKETLLPETGSIPLPEAVQTAEANRWLAAQELAIELVQRGGEAPAALIDRLAEALIVEDQQKLSFYSQNVENATQLSQTIDATQAQIAWLSIKYRVARRGYGLSIVPEWEAQAEQIRADLTKSYERLFALYADLVIALPNASQIDKATLERLRREVLAGELGRYPNYPEDQRQAQLLAASEKLIDTQPEIGIFVGVGAVENERLYTLIALN